MQTQINFYSLIMHIYIKEHKTSVENFNIYKKWVCNKLTIKNITKKTQLIVSKSKYLHMTKKNTQHILTLSNPVKLEEKKYLDKL